MRSICPLVSDTAIRGIRNRSQGLAGVVEDLYGTERDVSTWYLGRATRTPYIGKDAVLVVGVARTSASRHKRCTGSWQLMVALETR